MACEQYFYETVEGIFVDPGAGLFFMANLLSVTNKICEKAFKRNVNVKVLSEIVKTLMMHLKFKCNNCHIYVM